MLLIEVRHLHRGVLRQEWVAWLPIAYSGLMVLCGAAGLLGWDRGGRELLFWAFALAPLAALVGFWLHNMAGAEGLQRELTAWTEPPSRAAAPGPPPLAPLSLAGLG